LFNYASVTVGSGILISDAIFSPPLEEAVTTASTDDAEVRSATSCGDDEVEWEARGFGVETSEGTVLCVRAA
jgi:hypothetical protein